MTAGVHGYDPAPGGPCNTCGLAQFHEAHYGGNRQVASEAYQRYKRQLAKEGRVMTVPKPPKFKTVEEADAWLEQFA